MISISSSSHFLGNWEIIEENPNVQQPNVQKDDSQAPDAQQQNDSQNTLTEEPVMVLDMFGEPMEREAFAASTQPRKRLFTMENAKDLLTLSNAQALAGRAVPLVTAAGAAAASLSAGPAVGLVLMSAATLQAVNTFRDQVPMELLQQMGQTISKLEASEEKKQQLVEQIQGTLSEIEKRQCAAGTLCQDIRELAQHGNADIIAKNELADKMKKELDELSQQAKVAGQNLLTSSEKLTSNLTDFKEKAKGNIQAEAIRQRIDEALTLAQGLTQYTTVFCELHAQIENKSNKLEQLLISTQKSHLAAIDEKAEQAQQEQEKARLAIIQAQVQANELAASCEQNKEILNNLRQKHSALEEKLQEFNAISVIIGGGLGGLIGLSLCPISILAPFVAAATGLVGYQIFNIVDQHIGLTGRISKFVFGNPVNSDLRIRPATPQELVQSVDTPVTLVPSRNILGFIPTKNPTSGNVVVIVGGSRATIKYNQNSSTKITKQDLLDLGTMMNSKVQDNSLKPQEFERISMQLKDLGLFANQDPELIKIFQTFSAAGAA